MKQDLIKSLWNGIPTDAWRVLYAMGPVSDASPGPFGAAVAELVDAQR